MQPIKNIYALIGTMLLLIVFTFSSWNLLQYALVLSVMGLSMLFPAAIWSIPAMLMLIPILVSTVIISLFAKSKTALDWFRLGKIDIPSLIIMVLTSTFAACALLMWGAWSDNLGAGMQVMKSLSGYPAWLNLSVLIPAFALLNAFGEEAVYRGVIQEALVNVFPEKIVFVIFLQASAFAALHVCSGFPNGKLGYLMTLSYGCILGYLRFRTKGMVSPYLTHVAADLVIGYFLYLMV
jgi:membrane protease YdiL (CAAX protease family)